MAIKEAINKNWKSIAVIASIIISITILLLIAYYQLEITEQNYLIGQEISEEEYKEMGLLKNLPKGSIINQEFVAKYNNLEKIVFNIKIDTSKEYLNSKLKAEVIDDSGNILKQEYIGYDLLSISPNYELKFDKQQDSKGRVYSLKLKLDEEISQNNKEKESAVSLKNSDKKYKNCHLNLNEQIIDGSIIVVDKYNSHGRTVLFNISVIGIAILTFAACIFIYSRKQLKVETIFLLIVPILCLLYLIYMPMFTSHDEYRHWLRAYEVSEGKFLAEDKDGIIGTELPRSVSEIYTKQKTYKNVKYTTIKDFYEEEVNSNDRVFVDTSRVASYSPIQYIPETLGIVISRLITNKTIVMAYSARIVNLIVCMALMYFAIKTIPFGKIILLVLSMIPIAIEGFSTITADGLLISSTCLFIAHIFNLKYGNVEKIKFINKLILVILSAIIGLCKTVYIPIVLLLLLLPKRVFKNNKDRWITILIIAIIAIILNLCWLTISGIAKGEDEYIIETSMKTSSVIRNPIGFLQRLLYTMNVDGQKYVNTTFGGQLGWTETKVHSITPYGLCIIIFFAGIFNNNIKNRFSKSEILIISIIILSIVGAVFLALYVTWTDINSDKIEGVQGRYILPIIPLAVLLLGSILKVKTEYKEENMLKVASISGIILYINAIFTIIIARLG